MSGLGHSRAGVFHLLVPTMPLFDCLGKALSPFYETVAGIDKFSPEMSGEVVINTHHGRHHHHNPNHHKKHGPSRSRSPRRRRPPSHKPPHPSRSPPPSSPPSTSPPPSSTPPSSLPSYVFPSIPDWAAQVPVCIPRQYQPVAITGSTYYVSPNGNDSNSGTSPNSPWKSVTKVIN